MTVDPNTLRTFVAAGLSDAAIARSLDSTEARIKRARKYLRFPSRVTNDSARVVIDQPNLSRMDVDELLAARRVRFDDDPAALAECRPKLLPTYEKMQAMR